MIGAPNSLNLNCKVRVTKEVPGPSVSEEIADIFTNYNIDADRLATQGRSEHHTQSISSHSFDLAHMKYSIGSG